MAAGLGHQLGTGLATSDVVRPSSSWQLPQEINRGLKR